MWGWTWLAFSVLEKDLEANAKVKSLPNWRRQLQFKIGRKTKQLSRRGGVDWRVKLIKSLLNFGALRSALINSRFCLIFGAFIQIGDPIWYSAAWYGRNFWLDHEIAFESRTRDVGRDKKSWENTKIILDASENRKNLLRLSWCVRRDQLNWVQLIMFSRQLGTHWPITRRRRGRFT